MNFIVALTSIETNMMQAKIPSGIKINIGTKADLTTASNIIKYGLHRCYGTDDFINCIFESESPKTR